MSDTFLVESYWAEHREAAVRDRANQIAALARDLRGDGLVVTLLGALVIPDDEVCFWRFAGTSLAEVEETGRRAGLGFERTMQSIDIDIEHATDHDPVSEGTSIKTTDRSPTSSDGGRS